MVSVDIGLVARHRIKCFRKGTRGKKKSKKHFPCICLASNKTTEVRHNKTTEVRLAVRNVTQKQNTTRS